MAFFKKIKRAFGLSNEDLEDEEIEGIDATVHPLRQSAVETKAHDEPDRSVSVTVDSAAADCREQSARPAAINPDEIFESVVKIFNEALPDFIKSGINEDAQRKYIYNSLDDSIKDYLRRVEENTRELCRREWDSERRKLMSDSASLRDRIKAIEESSSENKKQQLSAERQKRALAERLHDLEGKIVELEAEKEQFELENRSLVNKLRVSNVISDVDSDALETIARLNETVETLRNENKELNASVEQFAVKVKMSDEMLNDLTARASASQAEAGTLRNEVEQLRDAKSVSEQREAELKTKVADISRELDSVREELEEAHGAMEMVDEIQAEMDKFETLKAKKDSKISELQTLLRQRDERVRALEIEVKSLHETISAADSEYSGTTRMLNDEISRLKAQLDSSALKESRRRKKTPIKISAIDEDLDNTDWLVATPPEGTNARPGGVPDNEFGYQEPVRKTPPENSAQMSLW